MKLLLTGAGGFIGSELTSKLRRQHELVAVYRKQAEPSDQAICLEFDQDSDWSDQLLGVDAIVHCAAKVHLIGGQGTLAEFRQFNTAATLNLARQAVAAGVKRFIFLSSIKVNGERTATDPFTEENITHCECPYARSKREAEEGLLELAETSPLEVIILRLPLVYGPGVKGNLLHLIQALKRHLPLPLGAVTSNRRTLLYLGNLVSLVERCLSQEQIGSQLFLVGDGESVSTARLCYQLKQGIQSRSILLPVPLICLRLLALVLDSEQLRRLIDNLQVDTSKIQKLLDWTAPYTVDEGLMATARSFKGA